jgi:hemerythrin-like metal-binding protein
MMSSTLLWSDSLALGLDVMDDTHREFIALLKQVDQAAELDLLASWQRVVDHTQDHFDREDRWMRSTGFSSSNCHTMQHQVVLQVMREVAARVQQSKDSAMLRDMSQQLGQWFLHHAQSMDAALALHLRSAGFDPLTGIVNLPEALPADAIHGCGSSVCSPTAQAVAGATAEADVMR